MNTSERMTNSQLKALLQSTEKLMLGIAIQTEANPINDLIRYHLDSGGGRVRAQLALTAGTAVGLNADVCVSLAGCCELVHNASLLHDDIQDKDTKRRGKEAAWSYFDTNTAMCAGTLMLSAAFEAVSQVNTDTTRLVQHLNRRTADLIRGQARDLHSQSTEFDTNSYLRMAACKSGSLFALPIELALIAGQKTGQLAFAKAAGESFAVAYQIADDLQDMEGDLQRENCNIVSVFLKQGLALEQAIAESSTLLETYLELALHNTNLLPHDCGWKLRQLCESLKQKSNTESNLNCEPI